VALNTQRFPGKKKARTANQGNKMAGGGTCPLYANTLSKHKKLRKEGDDGEGGELQGPSRRNTIAGKKNPAGADVLNMENGGSSILLTQEKGWKGEKGRHGEEGESHRLWKRDPAHHQFKGDQAKGGGQRGGCWGIKSKEKKEVFPRNRTTGRGETGRPKFG